MKGVANDTGVTNDRSLLAGLVGDGLPLGYTDPLHLAPNVVGPRSYSPVWSWDAPDAHRTGKTPATWSTANRFGVSTWRIGSRIQSA